MKKLVFLIGCCLLISGCGSEKLSCEKDFVNEETTIKTKIDLNYKKDKLELIKVDRVYLYDDVSKAIEFYDELKELTKVELKNSKSFKMELNLIEEEAKIDLQTKLELNKDKEKFNTLIKQLEINILEKDTRFETRDYLEGQFFTCKQ